MSVSCVYEYLFVPPVKNILYSMYNFDMSGAGIYLSIVRKFPLDLLLRIKSRKKKKARKDTKKKERILKKEKGL